MSPAEATASEVAPSVLDTITPTFDGLLCTLIFAAAFAGAGELTVRRLVLLPPDRR